MSVREWKDTPRRTITKSQYWSKFVHGICYSYHLKWKIGSIYFFTKYIPQTPSSCFLWNSFNLFSSDVVNVQYRCTRLIFSKAASKQCDFTTPGFFFVSCLLLPLPFAFLCFYTRQGVSKCQKFYISFLTRDSLASFNFFSARLCLHFVNANFKAIWSCDRSCHGSGRATSFY